MKILLMEDDPVLGDIISDYLRSYYCIDRAFDSEEAQSFIDDYSYDLFIFDINVPGKSGIELLETLRSFSDRTPAIVITAYEDMSYLKKSFDAGAHDYIRKPFELEELKLRIEKSKILFHIEQDISIKISEHVVYLPSQKSVKVGKISHNLRPKEAEILDYFISHPHQMISKDELIQNIWEFDAMPTDATLRSYIRCLREVIGAEKISTQRGLGYRYE
ncbi:MAG: response regulator transcription factor [Sulfurovum sp.]|nr:response regulator transcription factor [Sulfurovum sp.]